MRTPNAFSLPICLAVVAFSSAATAKDWPGWRGADRDGVVRGGPELPDAWDEGGLALLWESEEEIPSDHYGGHGGVAVVGDRVYLSVIWHRDVPTDTRTLDERAMRKLGHQHGNMDREFVDKVEAARVAMSPRLRGKKLDEFIEAWMGENLSANQRLKLDYYVKGRLKKGRAAIAIKDLDVVGEHKGKAFDNPEAFESWVRALPLDDAVKNEVRDAVPTSELAADDTVVCLDADTGKTLWKRALPGKKSARGHACTPSVVGERLYTVGSGNVHCLDAATGEHHWSSPVKGNGPGSSVLVTRDRVFVLADALYAFNAASGSLLWEQKGVKGKNSSPVVAGDHILVAGNSALFAVEPETGDIAWQVAGGGDSTPVVSGDIVVHHAKGKELHTLRALRFGDGEPELLWAHELRARRAASSPLIVDGQVYLLGGDRHLCADLASGEIRWDEARKSSISSPISADGKLFALENRGGTMVMLKASPAGHEELARGKVGALSTCSPALSGSRLYVRGERRVKCFSLE